jgi:hypothetical protein
MFSRLKSGIPNTKDAVMPSGYLVREHQRFEGMYRITGSIFGFSFYLQQLAQNDTCLEFSDTSETNHLCI